ncbi:MAG: Smr/MutS family protein [Hyphomicrobiaceae bacterium]
MTAKGGAGGKSRTPRTSHLNKDDADLWSFAARSVAPLRRAKSRVTAAVPDTPTADSAQPGLSRPASSLEPARRAHRERAAAPVQSTTHPRKDPPPLAEPDRRRVRKIATGQHEIEARLDLHGLRQSDAHRRLARFLHDAQSAGLTMVLVITGKGSARKPADDGSYARVEPGIIRRAVPLWLDEPGLRALVVSCTSAHPRHGGSGALYIHIRKRARR